MKIQKPTGKMYLSYYLYGHQLQTGHKNTKIWTKAFMTYFHFDHSDLVFSWKF